MSVQKYRRADGLRVVYGTGLESIHLCELCGRRAAETEAGRLARDTGDLNWDVLGKRPSLNGPNVWLCHDCCVDGHLGLLTKVTYEALIGRRKR